MTSTAARPPGARRLLSTSEGASAAAFAPLRLDAAPRRLGHLGRLVPAHRRGSRVAWPRARSTLGRVVFGWLALATLPGARRGRIDAEDRPRIALVGLLWMALPMTIFPIAEQWISSSVTGMLNGSMPLFAAAVAAIMLRRPPGRLQQAGIIVGFLGVVAISLPSMQGGSRTALGAVARADGDGLLRRSRPTSSCRCNSATARSPSSGGRRWSPSSSPRRTGWPGWAHRRSRGGRSAPWSCSAPSAPASPSSPRGR